MGTQRILPEQQSSERRISMLFTGVSVQRRRCRKRLPRRGRLGSSGAVPVDLLGAEEAHGSRWVYRCRAPCAYESRVEYSFFVVQKFANVLPVPVLQARACTQRPKCPRAACRAERQRYSSASPTFRGARNTLKSIVGHRHIPGPSRARYLRAELLPAGAEPPAVKALLDKLRPLCYGLSVCGAGGGGFVACITKNPGDQARRGVVVVVAFVVVGWWYSISSSVLCQTVFVFRTSRFGCVLRVLSGAACWEGKHPPSEEGTPPRLRNGVFISYSSGETSGWTTRFRGSSWCHRKFLAFSTYVPLTCT